MRRPMRRPVRRPIVALAAILMLSVSLAALAPCGSASAAPKPVPPRTIFIESSDMG